MSLLFPQLALSSLLAFASPEVQDAGFSVLAPDAHAHVSAVSPSRAWEEHVLSVATEHSQQILSELGVEAAVHGRVKSLLSRHNKMRRKGLSHSELADRIALRLRVDTEDDCYALLDAVHDRFDQVPGELDDYIAEPKSNGYRSLHTAVRVLGEPVEVQIRTHAMHEAAENGAAAHWRYKLAA